MSYRNIIAMICLCCLVGSQFSMERKLLRELIPPIEISMVRSEGDDDYYSRSSDHQDEQESPFFSDDEGSSSKNNNRLDPTHHHHHSVPAEETSTEERLLEQLQRRETLLAQLENQNLALRKQVEKLSAEAAAKPSVILDSPKQPQPEQVNQPPMKKGRRKKKKEAIAVQEIHKEGDVQGNGPVEEDEGGEHMESANYKLPPTNSKNPGVKRHRKNKVFVCLTGQVARLVLKKKISSFFQPMIDAGFTVDVALVATGGKPRFSNFKRIVHQAEWDNWEQIADYLKQHPGIHVLPKSKLNFTEPPTVPDDYVARLDKKYNGPEQQLRRAQNHARQYEMWTECYTILQTVTHNHPSSVYDSIVRIRDDVAFDPPFNFPAMLEIFDRFQYTRTMITTYCRFWGGLNDRFAMVSPDIAKGLYVAPHYRFAHAMANNDTFVAVMNPESYLFATFKQLKYNLIQSDLLVGIRRYQHANNQTKLGKEEDKEHCGDQTRKRNRILRDLRGQKEQIPTWVANWNKNEADY